MFALCLIVFVDLLDDHLRVTMDNHGRGPYHFG